MDQTTTNVATDVAQIVAGTATLGVLYVVLQELRGFRTELREHLKIMASMWRGDDD